jgi:predicted glycogen debranching enzyme
MSYLKFDSSQLVNLEYSLGREIIRSNRAGSYGCTTIIGCNTRKYHGLLVCPIEKFQGEKYVLLSTLDETVVQHDRDFNLGIHKFPGDNYYPKGHKYVTDFEAETVASTIYRVGGVILKKESLLVEKEQQVLIQYTLLEAHSPTKLQFRPFLAFRGIHELSKANMYADTRVNAVDHGIKSKLYRGFPSLYMQFSKESEFIHVPDWYYNIEYTRELERGYDYQEDLFTPGYFEVPIKPGETVIFSASTIEANPRTLKRKFNSERESRNPRDNYYNCLVNSANQFIVRTDKKTEIIAGFPWFGSWGRDTFISLPGLTLALGDIDTCEAILDTQVKKMKGGLFPNMGNDQNPAFNSVDAPMWFLWALQQYAAEVNDPTRVWEKYGKAVKAVLNGIKDGLQYNIKMQDDGLIHAGAPGKALTWMDAVVHDGPVTPRAGCPVEVNALWYNGIMFALELAEIAKDKKFLEEWKDVPSLVKNSFVEKFWDCEKEYLADYVDGDNTDWSVRPNQVVATALPYSMLTLEMCNSVLELVEKELLTPRGLRTLSPQLPNYKGVYDGGQDERDRAYHQGTVWPWLLEFFCQGYIQVKKMSGLSLLEDIYHGFEEEMMQHGIGSISEVYNGNPPHTPRGAISQAWSVAALLRIKKMIENYKGGTA